MNMYEIREVMAVFGFVQKYANCAQLCDKLDGMPYELSLGLIAWIPSLPPVFKAKSNDRETHSPRRIC